MLLTPPGEKGQDFLRARGGSEGKGRVGFTGLVAPPASSEDAEREASSGSAKHIYIYIHIYIHPKERYKLLLQPINLAGPFFSNRSCARTVTKNILVPGIYFAET